MKFTVITHFNYYVPEIEIIPYYIRYEREHELVREIIKCLENKHISYVQFHNHTTGKHKLYTKNIKHMIMDSHSHIASFLV